LHDGRQRYFRPSLVFNCLTMTRRLLAGALAAAGLAIAIPATAEARLEEIGKLERGVAGSCPRTCLAIPRTTGYQAKIGPNRGTYVVPRDGRIVAWTLSLGKPGPNQTKFFNERLGGEAQAALAVLQPGSKLTHRVVAKSPLQNLTEWFGMYVQFPLEETIPVKKGQLLALSVPTWAPALQVNLGGDTSWRSSRERGSCNDTADQSALVGDRESAQFYCLYRTARLTYSATLVSTP
jgi:hypothetical protein